MREIRLVSGALEDGALVMLRRCGVVGVLVLHLVRVKQELRLDLV